MYNNPLPGIMAPAPRYTHSLSHTLPPIYRPMGTPSVLVPPQLNPQNPMYQHPLHPTPLNRGW